MLLVRKLSQAEFGVYKQAFLIVGTAIVALPLGFHMSAYYFFPREPENRGVVALNILLFHLATTFLGFLTLLLFPQLLEAIFKSSELVPLAAAIGLIIVSWGIAAFLETLVVANQEPRLSAAFIVGAQFTKTVMLVGAAVLFGTVSALIKAALLQGVLQSFVLLFYMRSRFPQFWLHFDVSILRRQLSYSLPFGLAGLLYTLEMDFHNYFVSYMFGPTAFAVYAVGCTQLPLVNILNESVASAMIPRMSALQHEQRLRDILLLIIRSARKLSLVFFPLYVFLMAAGRLFIIALFTRRYESSWPIFAINLTLIPFLIFLVDPTVRAYASERHVLLRLHAVVLTVMAVVLLGFGKTLQLTSVITIVVGLNIFARLFMVGRIAKLIGAKWRDVALFKPVASVAIAALLAAIPVLILEATVQWPRPLIQLALATLAYGLTYAGLLLAFKTIDEDEWDLVRKSIRPLVQLYRTRLT